MSVIFLGNSPCTKTRSTFRKLIAYKFLPNLGGWAKFLLHRQVIRCWRPLQRRLAAADTQIFELVFTDQTSELEANLLVASVMKQIYGY